MRITDSTLQLASSHHLSVRHEVRESLRVWRGDRPDDNVPGAEGRSRAGRGMAHASEVALSRRAQEAAAADPVPVDEASETGPYEEGLSVLIGMIERLTGKRVEIFDSRELQGNPQPVETTPAPPADNVGAEYRRRETLEEHEQMTFAAQGIVRTADGREIRFELAMSMQRDFKQVSETELLFGNAQRKDPLVLNFNGTAAQLTDQVFQFDLDSDGNTEAVHQLAAGSGYLVFDRNGDGKANNGRELFGATSGDGFAELAAFDDDGNGWIDEGDAIFTRLRLWQPASSGANTWQTLTEAGVGAIATARVASPFALRSNTNAAYGDIVSSGVYLTENGGAGSVQQIDLAV